MSSFIVFDSKSKTKRHLDLQVKKKVKLYVCGMTVYDRCHIGHGRVMVFFDTFVRCLRAFEYAVQYVRNVTDIDDKIIQRAQCDGTDWLTVAKTYTQKMQEDECALNVLPPDETPKATEFMSEMIAMIETLISRDYAYVAEDGDVYFSVRNFRNYGNLSHQDLGALTASVRKALSSHKRDNLDFVLWKLAKQDEPGWSSPWGKGRPGWHIECSAMATTLLGEQIDIHGGGVDLKFPHHENETAQSEAATGKPFVRQWMHVGHVMSGAEKMSKSLGNFSTIHTLLESFQPEVLRYFLLSTHYRSPLQFSHERLIQSRQALSKLYNALLVADLADDLSTDQRPAEFDDAIVDDMNIPKALSVCFELSNQIHILKKTDPSTVQKFALQLQGCLRLLGLGFVSPKSFLQDTRGLQITRADIEATIQQRQLARENKNWQLADQLREKLSRYDIVLEDSEAGTQWQRH